MGPIELNKAGGGRSLVDPDNVASVEEFRGQTVVVTDNYQVYWIETSLDEIQKKLGLEARGTAEEE